MKSIKMYLNYYFDTAEFVYEVDKDEVVERFGEEPEYDADFNDFEEDFETDEDYVEMKDQMLAAYEEKYDEWLETVMNFYEGAARSEAKRISDENEAALEALKDDYMRSV